MEVIVNAKGNQINPGQTVSGVVRLTADQKVSDVKVELHGCARVEWTELASAVSRPTNGHTHVPKVGVGDHKRFLELTQEVTDGTTHHPKDIYFSFKLPDTLIPPSVETKFGQIMYRVVATGKLADGGSCESDKVIRLMSPITGKLLIPIGNSVEKDFGLLSLAAGRIMMNVVLDKKGFESGETMQLSCHINNESTVDATPRAVIYQTQIYMSGEEHRSINKTITDPVVGECVPSEINTTQVLTIDIPSDAILSVKSELISIKYFIHVTLDIPQAFDVHADIPFLVTNEGALRGYTMSKLYN